MHSKSCTRANSPRTAVRELINERLREIGDNINANEKAARELIRKSSKLDSINKQIEDARKRYQALYTELDKQIKAESDAYAKQFEKQRNHLCDLRSEVLFAKQPRLREMYAELTKKGVSNGS